MFIVNVEGAVYREGKWLLIERSRQEEHAGGLLSLVGGTVEREANAKRLLERTLVRELFEEVGVEVKDELRFVGSSSFSLASGAEVLNIVFLCEWEKGEPWAKSPEEVAAVHWLSADDIMRDANAPVWLRESIHAAEAVRRRNG